MKYIRYRSFGNTVGIEEGVDDYWEIDSGERVVRSVSVKSDGSHLKYDRVCDADQFGALPEGCVTDEMLADGSVGLCTVIGSDEFEAMWAKTAKNR